MVDRFSGFPWAERLTSTTTTVVLSRLKRVIYEYGFPKTIRSDGGPQFRSEFDDFCREKSIIHEKSSPYHLESNGHAEAGVKAVKHLLKKCLASNEDFAEALFEWRNVPRQDGYSPASMLFGRRQRGLLPALDPDPIDLDNAAASRRRTRESGKSHFDQRTKTLPTLAIGQSVILQHPVTKLWDLTGVISAVSEQGRSYEVETDTGKKTRNRRFIRPTSLSPGGESADKVDSDTTPPLSPILRRSERLAGKKPCQIQFAG